MTPCPILGIKTDYQLKSSFRTTSPKANRNLSESRIAWQSQRTIQFRQGEFKAAEERSNTSNPLPDKNVKRVNFQTDQQVYTTATHSFDERHQEVKLNQSNTTLELYKFFIDRGENELARSVSQKFENSTQQISTHLLAQVPAKSSGHFIPQNKPKEEFILGEYLETNNKRNKAIIAKLDHIAQPLSKEGQRTLHGIHMVGLKYQQAALNSRSLLLNGIKEVLKATTAQIDSQVELITSHFYKQANTPYKINDAIELGDFMEHLQLKMKELEKLQLKVCSNLEEESMDHPLT